MLDDVEPTAGVTKAALDAVADGVDVAELDFPDRGLRALGLAVKAVRYRMIRRGLIEPLPNGREWTPD